MDKIDFLITGLGNPGDKYQSNRHNIGYIIAQAFVNKYRGKFAKHSKFSYISKLTISGKRVIVCLPITFMNLSGKAIKELTNEFGINTKDTIVICDEYNFPFGRIHYKANGSDGGHNGIGSVIDELEATNFVRLRVGIDKNFGSGELVEYVLSDFNEEETKLLPDVVKKGIQALEEIIFTNHIKAMNKINSKEFQFNYKEPDSEEEDKIRIEKSENGTSVSQKVEIADKN